MTTKATSDVRCIRFRCGVVNSCTDVGRYRFLAVPEPADAALIVTFIETPKESSTGDDQRLRQIESHACHRVAGIRRKRRIGPQDAVYKVFFFFRLGSIK